MVLAAIGSVLFGSGGTILAKRLLKTVEYHRYLAMSFVIAFIFMLFFAPGFFVWQSLDLFTICVLIVYAVNAVFMNIFYLKGFVKEKLTESQSILLLSPLVIVVLAAIMFPDERKFVPLLLAIISLGAVLWSHSSHQHVHFHKGSRYLFASVVLIAFDSLLVKQLLTVMSPFTLYITRMALVGSMLYTYYRPKWRGLTHEQVNLTVLTSIFPVFQYVLYYWSIASLGLVVTSLIVSMQPMLTYMFARLELREQVTKRHLSATIVIFGCVLLSQIL